MRIARGSIDRLLPTWIVILVSMAGGLWAFLSLGRLEDPAFTIKQAVVETRYPGASAGQVAVEVSEPLESAIQKMSEVDRIDSINRPGVSRIEVHIDSRFDGSELPAIWTELRATLGDAARRLPPGVEAPLVNDRFGDVFGIYYAVTAEGFSDAEKHGLATFLRRELLAVEGVADVNVSGLPEEAIFVEPKFALAVNLSVPPQVIARAIANANSVVDAGSTEAARIAAPAGSGTVSEIAGLAVGVGGETINLTDLATVSRGRLPDPGSIVRFDGVEAFTLGVAGLAIENIVAVGKRVERRLAELERAIPVGVELNPIYRQHRVVEEASNDFVRNLAMSVAIVTVVLALFMGWRAGAAVGTTLLLTVLGTLLFMMIFSIEMERISLGGLIIAMGMLVDNAIVVAEGMQIAMLRGRSSRDAADEAAARTQIPLLGATVIGIMAFAGIGLSPDATGEFLFSLFAVIGISLLLSWMLAVTVTPLLGHYFFRRGGDTGEAPYGSLPFRVYGAVLRGALKLRWPVVAALIALTAASMLGFTQLRQQFFPDSNTPIFFVHYKLPQGTSIHRVAEDLASVEVWLAARADVDSVATFVGRGASRFVLTYAAQKPNPSYGHLIVRVRSVERIPALRAELEAFGRGSFPEGEFRTRRPVFGPGGGDPIAVRFSGTDPKVLRSLGREAMARMAAASTELKSLRTDWGEQELVIRPVYASARAQAAGIAREDIAATLKFATDGIGAGGVSRGRTADPDHGAPAAGFRPQAGRPDGLFRHGRRLHPHRAGDRGFYLRGAEHAGSPARPLADPDGGSRHPTRQDGRRTSRRDPLHGGGHVASPGLPDGLGRRVRGLGRCAVRPRGTIAPELRRHGRDLDPPVQRLAAAAHYLAAGSDGGDRGLDRAAGHRPPLYIHRPARAAQPVGHADQERHRSGRGDRSRPPRGRSVDGSDYRRLHLAPAPGVPLGGDDDPRHDSAVDRRILRLHGGDDHERAGVRVPADAGGGSRPLLSAVRG